MLTQLAPADGAADDYFGNALAVEGDLLVAGAAGDDELDIDAGAVHLFRYDAAGWVFEQKLLACDGAAFDGFGGAVAVSDDDVIVGAAYADLDGTSTGAVYVFRFNGQSWEEVQKLDGTDGGETHQFGNAVAIDGERLVVGAFGDDSLGSYAGAVYAFRIDGLTWVMEQKFFASDGAANAYFGTDVALDGDTAVIGADGDDQGGVNAGAAYVFHYDGTSWVEQQKLVPQDLDEGDDFGTTVSISEQRILVGADFADVTGKHSGSVYAFEFDGVSWVQTQKLLPASLTVFEYFGIGLDMDGDTAVIGSYGDTNSGIQYAGATYVYKHDGTSWVEQQKLVFADNPLVYATAGTVAYADGHAAILAPVGQDFGDALYTIYAYDDLALDCNGNGSKDDCDLTDGTSLDLNLNGVPDECDPPTCLGDFDLNGTLDPLDSGFILARLGCAVDGGDLDCDRSDVNGDHIVDPLDVGYVLSRFGDCPSCDFQTRLLDPRMNDDDDFGYSVSLDHDTLLVGAIGDHFNGLNAGAAYVYTYNGATWQLSRRLLPADPSPGAYFGAAVEVEAGVAVVGAPYDPPEGAAYVFRNVGAYWPQEAKLTVWDGDGFNHHFGTKVALSEDVVIIGAYDDDEQGPHAGAAYSFRFDGTAWQPEQKILASNGDYFYTFGLALSLSGTTAVIGAPAAYDDDLAGAVYVFEYRDGLWIERQILQASDTQPGDSFGYSVALSDDVIVVGAAGHDGAEEDTGAAYVFRFDGASWVEERKLVPDDLGDDDYFGTSVAVAGNHLLVGAVTPYDVTTGRVYRYSFDGVDWLQEETFYPDGGFECSLFGASVSLYGDRAAIGAPWDYDYFTLENPGTVHIFTGLNGDCNANGQADACDINGELSDDSDADGIPDDCGA